MLRRAKKSDAPRAAGVLLTAILAIACAPTEPKMQKKCGFRAGASVVITYENGQQVAAMADSQGCVSYRSGTNPIFTPIN